MQQGERVHSTQCGWILTAKWCTYILALVLMIILLNTKRRLCLRKEALGSSKLPKLTWHNTCFIYGICWQLKGIVTPLFSLDSESTKTPMSLGVGDQDTGFIIMAVGDWRCDVDPKSK